MRNCILDQEKKLEIIKKKKTGVGNIELSIEYKVSVKTIGRITKGIKRTSIKQNRTVLNPEEVYSKYKELNNLNALSAFYKKSPNSLKTLLNKNGYTINSITTARQYFFDINFFENIDTEERAYWLGFLYADGSLSKRNLSIACHLQYSDRTHLEKLAQILKYTGKIQLTKQTNCWSITLSSQKMCTDLVSKGCFYNKTYLLRFPTEEQVPNHLIRHFIRGYFDGDGCITTKPLWSIVGNYLFIEELQKKLVAILDLNYTKLYKHKSFDCYSVLYGGKNQVLKLYNYLYTGGSIYLQRKKEKYEKINNLFCE